MCVCVCVCVCVCACVCVCVEGTVAEKNCTTVRERGPGREVLLAGPERDTEMATSPLSLVGVRGKTEREGEIVQ